MGKILSEKECIALFNECLDNYFFLDTLNDYEQECVFGCTLTYDSVPPHKFEELEGLRTDREKYMKLYERYALYRYQVENLNSRLTPKFGWTAQVARMGGPEYEAIFDKFEAEYGLEIITEAQRRRLKNRGASHKIIDYILHVNPELVMQYLNEKFKLSRPSLYVPRLLALRQVGILKREFFNLYLKIQFSILQKEFEVASSYTSYTQNLTTWESYFAKDSKKVRSFTKEIEYLLAT